MDGFVVKDGEEEDEDEEEEEYIEEQEGSEDEEEQEEAEDEEQDDLEDESEQDNDAWPTQDECDSWLKTNKQPVNDTEESHCYVSCRHNTRFPRKNFPAKVLEAQTVIVTCGMKNFEFSSYSNSRSRKFRNHLGDRKVHVDHFRKPKQEHFKDKEIFSESFKRAYLP